MTDEAINAEAFDFSLDFLNSYVSNEAGTGKGGYQNDKSLVFNPAMSIANTPGLNFGPYDAPTRGVHKGSSALQESNPLFAKKEEDNEDDNKIKLKNVKTKW